MTVVRLIAECSKSAIARATSSGSRGACPAGICRVNRSAQFGLYYQHRHESTQSQEKDTRRTTEASIPPPSVATSSRRADESEEMHSADPPATEMSKTRVDPLSALPTEDVTNAAATLSAIAASAPSSKQTISSPFSRLPGSATLRKRKKKDASEPKSVPNVVRRDEVFAAAEDGDSGLAVDAAHSDGSTIAGDFTLDRASQLTSGLVDRPGQEASSVAEGTNVQPQGQSEERQSGESDLEVGLSPAKSSTLTFPHPFDTHAFVQRLQKDDCFSESNAKGMMEVVRTLLISNGEKARNDMLSKKDLENEAYLFRAALSELRTELQVNARNDALALRSITSLLQREVDSLRQGITESVAGMKNNIELDMNNRKNEVRTEQKDLELKIQELNNKFTIALGDHRTEIEQTKWDTTRRGIMIIAFSAALTVTWLTLAMGNAASAAEKPETRPPPTSEELGIRPDGSIASDEAYVQLG